MSSTRSHCKPLLRGVLCLSLALLPCACQTTVPIIDHSTQAWNSSGFWRRVSDNPPSWVPRGLPLRMPSSKSGEWIVDGRDGWRFFVPAKGVGGLSAEAIRAEALKVVNRAPGSKENRVFYAASTGGASSGTVIYEDGSTTSDWYTSDISSGYHWWGGHRGHGHHHDHDHDHGHGSYHGHHNHDHDHNHGSGSGSGGSSSGNDGGWSGSGGGSSGSYPDHSGGGHHHGNDHTTSSGSSSSSHDSPSSHTSHSNDSPSSSSSSSSSNDSHSDRREPAESRSEPNPSTKEGMADKHR
ncbi:MAG TPA: hypothetical protein VG796_14235 [Verrucomicrobiales bacterium]|nr:hypothetical protein [Verrucomicrobiales bacterium]